MLVALDSVPGSGPETGEFVPGSGPEKAIEIRTAEFGKTHRSVQRTRLNLASCLDQLGKTGEAAAIRAEYGP